LAPAPGRVLRRRGIDAYGHNIRGVVDSVDDRGRVGFGACTAQGVKVSAQLVVLLLRRRDHDLYRVFSSSLGPERSAVAHADPTGRTSTGPRTSRSGQDSTPALCSAFLGLARLPGGRAQRIVIPTNWGVLSSVRRRQVL
jgi:hypothetical protein